jgi:hypothetical protein
MAKKIYVGNFSFCRSVQDVVALAGAEDIVHATTKDARVI